MNRVIEVTPVKTFVIVVLGIGVLALAAYGAQAVLTSEPEFGPVVAAPATEEAAPATDTSGLERDLKDFVREQVAANEVAAPAIDTSGLERDVKDFVRGQVAANEVAAPAIDTSGLERDLKDVVRNGMTGGPQEE